MDSVDEDEVAEGKELLAAKADKYRDSFIANQDKYLMPNPPEKKAEVVPDNTAEQKAKENIEAYVKNLTEDSYTMVIRHKIRLTTWKKNGEKMSKEMVNGPAHYGGVDNPYEVIKVCEAWGLDYDAYLFNVVKYVARAGKKDDTKELEDLKKAAFYLDRKIKNLQK